MVPSVAPGRWGAIGVPCGVGAFGDDLANVGFFERIDVLRAPGGGAGGLLFHHEHVDAVVEVEKLGAVFGAHDAEAVGVIGVIDGGRPDVVGVADEAVFAVVNVIPLVSALLAVVHLDHVAVVVEIVRIRMPVSKIARFELVTVIVRVAGGPGRGAVEVHHLRAVASRVGHAIGDF